MGVASRRLSTGEAVIRAIGAGAIVTLVAAGVVAAIGTANPYVAASSYLRILYGFVAVWAIMTAMQRAGGDPAVWITLGGWLLAVGAVGVGLAAAIMSSEELTPPGPEVETDLWGLIVAATWAQAIGATVGAFIKHDGDSVFEWIAESAGRR